MTLSFIRCRNYITFAHLHIQVLRLRQGKRTWDRRVASSFAYLPVHSNLFTSGCVHLEGGLCPPRGGSMSTHKTAPAQWRILPGQILFVRCLCWQIDNQIVCDLRRISGTLFLWDVSADIKRIFFNIKENSMWIVGTYENFWSISGTLVFWDVSADR